MRRLLPVAMLIASSVVATAQTFVDPGPDPACGGTELRVVQRADRLTFIEHTTLQSFRTVVEQYRLLKNGDWKIRVLFYSSRWMRNEPVGKQHLIQVAGFSARAAISSASVC